MKPLNLFRNKFAQPRLLTAFSLAALTFSLAAFSQIGRAQSPDELSLADILVGLRSKKVTLEERNSLLAEAIRVRGITFALTQEIETELTTTGASKELIEAVRQKAPKVPAIIPASLPAAPAADTPDANFYRNRANENNVKGDFELALEDYGKAIELNPKDNLSYFSRGRVHLLRQSYDLAILDFDKTIELNPKDVAAYANRAAIYEKKGNQAQAIADYRKAVELDANNESAKRNLKRLEETEAKIAAAKQPAPPPTTTVAATTAPAPVKETPAPIKQNNSAPVKEDKPVPAAPAPVNTAPKTVELGQLNASAVKMVMPVYPDIAKKLNALGKVVVQVTIDETGKVTSAKATSGNSFLRGASETAAEKSRFKPALSDGQPVKATGFIVYNFVDQP